VNLNSYNLYYPQSAEDTITVGAEIARLAKQLVNNKGLPRAKLYCVGHSLGAHACGAAGRHYKFGRITGINLAYCSLLHNELIFYSPLGQTENKQKHKI